MVLIKNNKGFALNFLCWVRNPLQTRRNIQNRKHSRLEDTLVNIWSISVSSLSPRNFLQCYLQLMAPETGSQSCIFPSWWRVCDPAQHRYLLGRPSPTVWAFPAMHGKTILSSTLLLYFLAFYFKFSFISNGFRHITSTDFTWDLKKNKLDLEGRGTIHRVYIISIWFLACEFQLLF